MDKIIKCGQCKKFLYEDIDGWGMCGLVAVAHRTYCGDDCFLNQSVTDFCTDYGTHKCGLSENAEMFDSDYCCGCY